jgi:hypothetical protein
MTEEPNNRLKQFLNEGRNWERKATNIPGVFLFRLPASKGSPASLAIEINPIDTYGSITKRRGIVIRSSSDLDEISRLLSDPKVGELSKKIDAVNPKREAITSKGMLFVVCYIYDYKMQAGLDGEGWGVEKEPKLELFDPEDNLLRVAE